MGEATSGNLLWAMVAVVMGLLWGIRELIRFVTQRRQGANGHVSQPEITKRVNVSESLTRDFGLTREVVQGHYAKQDKMIEVLGEISKQQERTADTLEKVYEAQEKQSTALTEVLVRMRVGEGITHRP